MNYIVNVFVPLHGSLKVNPFMSMNMYLIPVHDIVMFQCCFNLAYYTIRVIIFHG